MTALTYSRPVVKEAFNRALWQLPPAIIEACATEFSSTYPVLGTKDAFEQAVAKVPTIAPADYGTLFRTLGVSLRAAQEDAKEKAKEAAQKREAAKTESERQAAQKAAADLKVEVDKKASDFRQALRDSEEVKNNILKAAMPIRKLASNSGYGDAKPVVEAIDDLNKLTGEAERLIASLVEIGNGDVRNAKRESDVATIEDSIEAADAIRRRLDAILGTDIPEADDSVKEAIKSATIQKIAADAKANLDAIEDGESGIVAKTVKAVQDYNTKVREKTGAAPTDNPEAQVTAAKAALTAAKTAYVQVEAAVASKQQTAAETAATTVSAQKTAAQAALDEITRRTDSLKSQEINEGAVETFVLTSRSKAEGSFVGKMKKRAAGHWLALSLTAAAALLVFFFSPFMGMPLGWALIALAVILVVVAYTMSVDPASSSKVRLALATLAVTAILVFGVAPRFGGSNDGGNTPTPSSGSSDQVDEDQIDCWLAKYQSDPACQPEQP